MSFYGEQPAVYGQSYHNFWLVGFWLLTMRIATGRKEMTDPLNFY